MKLNKLFLILAIISIPFIFFKIYIEFSNKKISIVADYSDIIFDYYNNKPNSDFEFYLKTLKKLGLTGVFKKETKIIDFINEYNEVILLKGNIAKEIYPNAKFINKKFLYLIMPKNIYEKIIELDYNEKKIFNNLYFLSFEKNYSVLSVEKILYKSPMEEFFEKANLKIFIIDKNSSEGIIDSFLYKNVKTGIYFISAEPIKGNYKIIAKIHSFNKRFKSKEELISEYIRSVLERNVRILCLPKINFIENKISYTEIISEIKKELEKYKFKFLSPEKIYNENFNYKFFYIFKILSFIVLSIFILQLKKNKSLFLKILIIIFLFAIFLLNLFHLIIVIAGIIWLNEPYFKKEVNFFNFAIRIIFLGIIINLFLSNLENSLISSKIFGIKFIFIIPFVITLFYIEPKILQKPLKRIEFIFILFFLSLFSIIILRMDNFKFPQFYYEKEIRYILEKIFIVRPRFKELLFYPFLFISFYKFKNKNIFYFLGTIAISTTLNSFIHLHTPIIISIIRSFYGIISGFIAGNLFILIYEKYFYKRLFRL